jgi:hypothetical protein
MGGRVNPYDERKIRKVVCCGNYWSRAAIFEKDVRCSIHGPCSAKALVCTAVI